MKKTPAEETSREIQRNEGATVVITHRVREDMHEPYEEWLNEIGPLCRASPGHLDWHMVRPIRGLSEAYTVIIRFDTEAHLRQWMESQTRAKLIEKAKPYLATDDEFFISSGLDFWFAPQGAMATIPVRWKQSLVTWSAIYPLVLAVPLVVGPMMRFVGLQENYYIDSLFYTAAVVWLMTYVVMPHYTRLMQRWVFW
ncbi:MAG: antibiotic biosynthesis monooxygenase [Luteolibacter sp.]